MPYLILVKHSLPQIDPHLRPYEWRLSEEGEQRARELAKKLEAYHPHAIATSPEAKAFETGRILAGQLARPIETVPGLEEHHRRLEEYTSQEEFESKIAELFRQPDMLVFGEETADQAHDRFHRAIESLLQKYQQHTLLVVSHGTVISLFVARKTGTDPYELWQRLALPSFITLSLPTYEVQEIGESG